MEISRDFQQLFIDLEQMVAKKTEKKVKEK